MNPGNIGAVFFFEWQRALTPARMVWWLILTLFPIFIVTLARLIFNTMPDYEHRPPGESWPLQEPWLLFLFALIPMLVSMLGSLLWTAPAVSSELERQSWIYLAVRPHGKTALLLGKYLAAVTWVLSAALLGLSVCVVIAQTEDPWHLWSTIAKLACIACPAYAALYMALGTLFPQRAMAIAVAYTLVFELVVSWVPAIINKLTVQYRLLALLQDWGSITFGNEMLILFGYSPAWFHVSMLASSTVGLLILSIVVVNLRELTTTNATEG
jgi:ABC-type transport system involved in multi-copper enzyme maturation permease subunit